MTEQNDTIVPGRWDENIALPDPRSNRKVQFIHHVEAAISRSLMKILRGQPIDKAAARMDGLMRAIGPMIRSTHQKGHNNLKLVYPNMTAAERAAILRDVWGNLGSVVAEFAHMDKLADRCEVIGAEKLLPYTPEGGKHAMFFSGHLANWEVMTTALTKHEVRYGVIYRAANNPLVDQDIINRRATSMSRWQIPKGKRGARDILSALQKGVSVCILTDQKFNDGLSVPFMGHPAMTAPAAARLVVREDIPFVPLQLIRLPNSRFKMIVHDPLEVTHTGDATKDTADLCRRMNDKLSTFVYEHPEQWLWLHRRWPRELV